MFDETARAPFDDRAHAARLVAAELHRYLQGQDPVVLAVPLGGVPVAAAIASELRLPLDLVISRRIQPPPEFGLGPDDNLGAIAPDRTLVVNGELVRRLGLSEEQVEQLSIPG